MKYLVGIMALAIATPASASDWVQVSSAADGMKGYLDLDTVKFNSGRTVVWLRFDYGKPAKDGAVSTKQQSAIDCENRTVTLLAYIEYKADGSVGASETLKSYEQQAQPVAPDTSGEAIVNLVCQK